VLGTLVNCLTILLGGGVGLLLRGKAPERMRETITRGLGLASILIGLRGALSGGDTLCVIVSLVVGALIGEGLDIELRLERVGARAQRLLAADNTGGAFVQGFMAASLLFCVGAMSVVGALEGGLYGQHATLFAKAAMDGVSALFLASAMGPGTLLAALSALVYQGGIVLAARWLEPLLAGDALVNMSAVGGLLIVGIGLNLTGATKLRTGNLLPAMFVPLAYIPIAGLFS